MIVADEIQRQYCKQNIGTIRKRINLRVRVTPNFGRWSCKNKQNKLIKNLIFGRMVVHKERINERKKIIYFCRMVVCKEKNKLMWSLIFGRMVVYK